MSYKILTINPGSTSTKISLFVDDKEVVSEKLKHDSVELAKYNRIIDQKEYRASLIREALNKSQYKLTDLDAVVGRGGLLRPIPSGTYQVNQKMMDDLTSGRTDHASNLGAMLAQELANVAKCPAFIVDPVVVDEFDPLARYSGCKHIERQSIFHALNHKAVARKIAEQIGKKYEDCNFVVAHLGGGISVGPHLKGRVIDNNNALDGEGPFSPERTGSLPAGQWLELITSGKYEKSELKKLIKGKGGFMSYLETADAILIEQKVAQGDVRFTEVQNAMCYQISKDIGASATALCGKVDRIIITGGLAYNSQIINEIKRRTEWIAPIEVVPGENEMEALYLGGKRVLSGQEEVKQY